MEGNFKYFSQLSLKRVGLTWNSLYSFLLGIRNGAPSLIYKPMI